jgi:hypothetical protein
LEYYDVESVPPTPAPAIPQAYEGEVDVSVPTGPGIPARVSGWRDTRDECLYTDAGTCFKDLGAIVVNSRDIFVGTGDITAYIVKIDKAAMIMTRSQQMDPGNKDPHSSWYDDATDEVYFGFRNKGINADLGLRIARLRTSDLFATDTHTTSLGVALKDHVTALTGDTTYLYGGTTPELTLSSTATDRGQLFRIKKRTDTGVMEIDGTVYDILGGGISNILSDSTSLYTVPFVAASSSDANSNLYIINKASWATPTSVAIAGVKGIVCAAIDTTSNQLYFANKVETGTMGTTLVKIDIATKTVTLTKLLAFYGVNTMLFDNGFLIVGTNDGNPNIPTGVVKVRASDFVTFANSTAELSLEERNVFGSAMSTGADDDGYLYVSTRGTLTTATSSGFVGAVAKVKKDGHYQWRQVEGHSSCKQTRNVFCAAQLPDQGSTTCKLKDDKALQCAGFAPPNERTCNVQCNLNCASLYRQSCNTDNACGPCLGGFASTAEPGSGNSPCVANALSFDYTPTGGGDGGSGSDYKGTYEHCTQIPSGTDALLATNGVALSRPAGATHLFERLFIGSDGSYLSSTSYHTAEGCSNTSETSSRHVSDGVLSVEFLHGKYIADWGAGAGFSIIRLDKQLAELCNSERKSSKTDFESMGPLEGNQRCSPQRKSDGVYTESGKYQQNVACGEYIQRIGTSDDSAGTCVADSDTGLWMQRKLVATSLGEIRLTTDFYNTRYV